MYQVSSMLVVNRFLGLMSVLGTTSVLATCDAMSLQYLVYRKKAINLVLEIILTNIDLFSLVAL